MRFYQKPARKPTIIIVTMIDIFSVLLIFFVVATTFKKNRLPAIQIALPEAQTAVKISQTEPMLLSVSSDEKVFLNSKEISVSQLKDVFVQLARQNPMPPIAMQADSKASFGVVIKVMDAAKAAGFNQLPAFVEPEK